MIKSADKHQQKAAHEGKMLEMDNNKDYLVPDEASAETDCSIEHLSLIYNEYTILNF